MAAVDNTAIVGVVAGQTLLAQNLHQPEFMVPVILAHLLQKFYLPLLPVINSLHYLSFGFLLMF